MHLSLRTKDPAAVEGEVRSAYRGMFPQADPSFVALVFGWVVQCFEGRYRDYQAVDLLYHDFEHTLQGTLCLARLLHGRYKARAQPALSQRAFELTLIGILLHDTGYLKRRDDTAGTGAKYTITHVERSAAFAQELLAEKGFPPAEIRAVQNMIQCTGVDAGLSTIQFQSDQERLGGFALAAADLLGQMAAEDYTDKLPYLFAEFAEAVRFTGNTKHLIARFRSAEELMEDSPSFWRNFVLVKLDQELGGMHHFLNDPYPSGPNGYLERIEANMRRLKSRLQASAAAPQPAPTRS